ncbi:MAG: polysaccharide biosynthesis tyrosine autokinase [Phycisphaerae bacterium]|nr:polysaccharide biosynthesis tyrosine autokinase [Phycisphaerae bacterium]
MTTLTAATASAPGLTRPAAARPQPGGALGFTAGDLLRIVRQRLVMVLFLWLFLVGATIGGTAYWAAYYPEFRTEGYIKVESTRPEDPMEQKPDRVDVQAMEMLVKDQAIFVTSPDVLSKALEDPEVKRTSWYTNLIARNDPTISMIDELADIIDAAPYPATSFLVVSVRGRVPNELPTIVNTVMNKYELHVNELSRTRYREEFDRLQKEAERAKKLLEDKNAAIDEFRQTAPASVFTTGGANVIGDELMTLTSLKTELEMVKLGRQQIWESLRAVRPEDAPVTAEMLAALNNDPGIFNMRTELERMEAELAISEANYGPKHRAVDALRVRVEGTRKRLMAAEIEKLNQYKAQQLQLAEQDYLQAQEQELAIAERLEGVIAKQRDLDQKFAQYLRHLEERDVLKAGYDSLLAQREALNLMLRRDKTVRITVASYAIPPKRRASPSWLINVPVGIVVGLMLSIGLAVLLELADSSVRTPRDVLRHAAMPVIGTIPALDDEEVEIERIELACIEAPRSVIAEAFRQLRTNLFFAAPVEHQAVLLVTSPGAEDGKTTVAVNLATSVAISGRRVLLIDANFRRPALRNIFAEMRAEGLSNVLIGQSKLADLVTPSGVPGLDLLSTGPTPPNPAELLGGTYLREMLAEARSRYDQIIFDGPPVLLMSDPMVLAGIIDGVLLVCRFRSTSRGALLRARTQLEAINARLLGAVLNAVQSTRGGYFRKQYRAFYDYQAEEEETRKPSKRLSGKKREIEDKVPSEDAAAIGEQLAAIDSSDAEIETPPEGERPDPSRPPEES